MTRRGLALGVLVLGALALGLVFGRDRGLVVEAWVVAAAAAATLALLARLRRSLPLTTPLDELLPRTRQRDVGIDQLDAVRRQLVEARSSALDVHRFFRPNAVEIASVQLARRRGVDLTRQPEQARRLLGEDAWELVRPGRPEPAVPRARGLSTRKLETIVRRLEEI